MSIISYLDLIGALCCILALIATPRLCLRKYYRSEALIIAFICLITATTNAISAWSWSNLAKIPLGENWGDYLQILQPAMWGAFFYAVVESARRKQLEASQKNLRDVIEHMPVILQAFDTEGKVLAWNKKSEELSGKSLIEMQNNNNAINDIFPSVNDRKSILEECAKGGGNYENHLRTMQGKQGLRYIAWSNISKRFPIAGWGNWGVGLDITQQLKTQQELERIATHDELTQLPNRVLLRERLQHALQLNKKNGTKGALLMLDLDDFKRVNDRHGHPAGDKLLKNIGKRLSQTLQESDTLARVSGDEFVLLIKHIKNKNEAEDIAKQVLNTLANPFNIMGNEVRTTSSLGITVFPDDHDNADELIKNMDLALYAAKKTGKNAYQFYNRDMHSELRRKHFIAEKLEQAIEDNALALYYQPQIAVAENRLCGAEALLRWPNFEGGDLSPGVFIPVAESTGLMPKLGEWVIDRGFAQASCWAQQSRITSVSINLSVLQFYQSNLLNFLDEKLEQYQLAANLIYLEITESVVMRNADEAIKTVQDLKNRGFNIALDDFGTGYSSLAYLRHLPIDKLKIDRSFIRNVDTNHKDAAIVNTIIQLAQNLGLTVIAEGVETESQLKMLEQEGCHEIQGFYYAKPLAVSDFEQFFLGKNHPSLSA